MAQVGQNSLHITLFGHAQMLIEIQKNAKVNAFTVAGIVLPIQMAPLKKAIRAQRSYKKTSDSFVCTN